MSNARKEQLQCKVYPVQAVVTPQTKTLTQFRNSLKNNSQFRQPRSKVYQTKHHFFPIGSIQQTQKVVSYKKDNELCIIRVEEATDPSQKKTRFSINKNLDRPGQQIFRQKAPQSQIHKIVSVNVDHHDLQEVLSEAKMSQKNLDSWRSHTPCEMRYAAVNLDLPPERR